MDNITIPPEALEAAKDAYMRSNGTLEDFIAAACLAMLEHWPGMINWVDGIGRPKSITLPLQEPSDDK
jgi:hypothetical protein